MALAESLNAVWKHAKIHKDLRLEDAKLATQDLMKVYDKLTILATRELSEEATDIALTQNISFYDAVYIAATRKLSATLYTADQELHSSASKTIDTKLLKP